MSLLVVTAPAAAQRSTIGIFFSWGAFEDGNPHRCFAIARREGSLRTVGWAPFAAIGYWPGRGGAAQLHVRLARKKRPGSAVILRVDGRSFQLRAGGADAWAPNAATDAAIIAAMRRGIAMNVEYRTESGAFLRDRYTLRGAATAIDAAAIACARR